MVAKPDNGRTIGYIRCFDCHLNGPGKQPFFRARLDVEQSEALVGNLKRCAESLERTWFTLAITYDELSKLRLIRAITPRFESDAAEAYLRGEVFRVTGRDRSCNINFSEVGAGLLAARLQMARSRMRRFVEICVPNRHRERNLIEFIPDVDLEAVESPEHQKLAHTGEALAGETWNSDDFSDWEGFDA